MTTAYMICNRGYSPKNGFDDEVRDMNFFLSSSAALGVAKNWEKVPASAFIKELVKETESFPVIVDEQQEQQKHLSLFIHGYNNGWEASVKRYVNIRDTLYSGKDGLGKLVLFSWPSNGSVAGYWPDRTDAERSAPHLAGVFIELNEHLQVMQRKAAMTQDPKQFCRAKITVISHSMGNYVMQKALAIAAKRLNNPQWVSLINQLAMVAADVDNDLFQTDKPQDSDGSLMANLTYRISALYTGLDQTLGMSAGLKHFGTRRLGRSGLADTRTVWDNVFATDVSSHMKGIKNVHSGVFESKTAMKLLREILIGVDRLHLTETAST